MKRWATFFFERGQPGYGVPALAGGARVGVVTREISSVSGRAYAPPPEGGTPNPVKNFASHPR